MKPKFQQTQSGIEIIDQIDRQRFLIKTKTPVSLTPTDDDRTPYPMDTAVEITTNDLILPIDNTVYVRTPDGSLITEVQHNDEIVLNRSEYILDISGSLKVYAYVKGAVRICVEVNKTKIILKKPTPVVISARSYHTRPEATITTTADPADMMQAVSMFGSAIKMTTSERSYPTLRGHPPSIELGDKLDIPDELARPNSGVRIEIPPTYQHVFAISPLAYYLAAEIDTGTTPRLVIDTGYMYEIEGDQRFSIIIEKILKHIFLLDCVVQTEGETPTDLYERQAIEADLGFSIENVYEQTMAEQLEAYLETPFAIVEPYLPEWWLKTQLKSTADHVEFLPFAVNNLSTIMIKEEKDGFMRERKMTTSTNSLRDLAGNHKKTSAKTDSVIRQSWNDKDGTVIPSTKSLSAFQHRINQSPRDGSLEIEVVCNDPDMSEELVKVHGTYGNRDNLPFNITVHHDLSTTGLEEVLTRESDFVHYIGHIDSDGFRCSDGVLDAATVETIGTKTFFLNACQSYEQGLNLIEAGAIGGIVTLTEVQNSDAVDAGETIARLLNNGFPLYATLDILQKKKKYNQQYHIIGDEMLTIVQIEQGTPTISTITRGRENNTIEIDSYISVENMQGTICIPHLEMVDSYHIVPGKVQSRSITNAEIIDFLNIGTFPVLLDNELRWSNEIKTHEL
ncbi:hypothetical protein [Natronorubrum halophilum]|uniref:hypothetical protein n=1 Tax=Natronorubrum halophilum TaxID=1702106 RepID=UPI001EE8E5C8|nr:hypothetical protein [Natronorubrum halophilum]